MSLSSNKLLYQSLQFSDLYCDETRLLIEFLKLEENTELFFHRSSTLILNNQMFCVILCQ